MEIDPKVRLTLAREFTRMWWDAGPVDYPKRVLLSHACGNQSELVAQLRDYERNGYISILCDVETAGTEDKVMRLIDLPRYKDDRLVLLPRDESNREQH